jgi:hypothetical protein
LDGAALNVLESIGNADNYPWFDERSGSECTLNAVPEKRFRQIKVNDDTILNGVNGLDILWRSTDHLTCFVADGDDSLGTAHAFYRYDRWLINDDTSSTNDNERVGCAQVNGEVR